jgi:hypothetical protein
MKIATKTCIEQLVPGAQAFHTQRPGSDNIELIKENLNFHCHYRKVANRSTMAKTIMDY